MLTVVALEGWRTQTFAADALAVVGAGGVDALILLHVALRALPARVALTVALLIVPIPTAQHRAGVCNTGTHTHTHTHTDARTHTHTPLSSLLGIGFISYPFFAALSLVLPPPFLILSPSVPPP